MIGVSLHQYQITTRLGAGGMGEVFRARDTRLNREVAIKVLPADFASDPDRLRRFEQEAKTLAALNHPNILTIHDTGLHDGTPYLVSELLEGRTLREELASGPLPIRKATDYALQIANGLAAAHARGIVHRDLKPENIFLTKDNRLKILDFGLAKTQSTFPKAGDDVSRPVDDHTPTLLASTTPGVILGTPAYMSPEQVLGEPADHRSDIFSFGCVLHEMLSGGRAFHGENAIATLNAILSSEPPDLLASTKTPAPLERVVRRCLDKTAERRFQSASDLAFALESLAALPTDSMRAIETLPRKLRGSPFLPWAAATLICVAFLASVILIRDPKTAQGSPQVYKFQIPLPTAEMLDPTRREALAISPDGTKLAYAGAEALWVHRLDQSGDPVKLVSGRRILSPFWSPDSSEIGYFHDQKLYRIGPGSARPLLICSILEELPRGRTGEGGTWLPDGRIIYTTGFSNLYQVNAVGGTPSVAHALQESEQDFHDPSALPEGRGVLFIVHRAPTTHLNIDTLAMMTPEGKRKLLLQIPKSHLHAPVYSSGHIVFGRSDEGFAGAWAFPFSLESLERTGEPFRLWEGRTEPSASSTGALALLVGTDALFAPRQLVWVDRSGTILVPFGKPLPRLLNPRFSPNGRRVAVTAGESSPRIWLFDVATGSAMPWSIEEGETSHQWSSDGQKIIFRRLQEATYVRPVEGFGSDEVLLAVSTIPLGASHRYRHVRVPPSNRDGFVRLADDTNITYFPDQLQGGYYALSPDDALLAMFFPDDPEREEVYVFDFPTFQNRRIVSRGGGERVVWHPNSEELFFTASQGRELMSARLKSGTREFQEPVKLFDIPPSIHESISVTPFAAAEDGRLLMVQSITSASGNTTGSRLSVQIILNWAEQFREKK